MYGYLSVPLVSISRTLSFRGHLVKKWGAAGAHQVPDPNFCVVVHVNVSAEPPNAIAVQKLPELTR